MEPSRSFPVLFADHASALGGAEHSLLLLIEALDRDRFIPHLATRAGRLAELARQAAVVHQVPLVRLRGELAAPWRAVRGITALVKLIRRERIALVHSNTVRASLYAALAARLAGRPHVWHVHDILQDGVYVRLLCTLSDAIICVSRAAAAPLPCQGKIEVIPNGVRPGDYSPVRPQEVARLRASWGVPPAALVVGQAARLAPSKGQRDVITAGRAFLREIPGAYVVIIGGDIFGEYAPYVASLRETVRAGDGSERIVLAGHRDDMPVVLGALDVLVHGSDRESFGRVLVEAGAAGLPVVAYASGGVPEVVIHEETGLLVPPGDSDALTAALVRLARDPGLRGRLGASARARAAEHFDAEAVARRVESVYARLRGGAGARGRKQQDAGG